MPDKQQQHQRMQCNRHHDRPAIGPVGLRQPEVRGARGHRENLDTLGIGASLQKQRVPRTSLRPRDLEMLQSYFLASSPAGAGGTKPMTCTPAPRATSIALITSWY